MIKEKKKMGLLILISLVCGNMIGSGIFLLPSSLAKIGTLSLFSWLFTGIGAILLALVFAHISRFFPKTGGPYTYVRETMGTYLGFQTAYTYWIAIWVGNAAIALAIVGYLRVFFPVLANPIYTCFLSIGFVWCLTVINCFGVATAGVVQSVTTILKLVPILLIGIVGWLFIDSSNFVKYANITQPHLSTFSAISSGAALTFWAFIGLESATVPSGSVLRPERNIPLATILGTLLAGIAYILSSIVIMGIIPANVLQHSTSPFAQAAKVILGPWGQGLIAAGAIVSCFGALNGWVLLQGQVAMAVAKDKLFPEFFARTNKHQVPAYGMVVTSVLITFLLLLTLSDNLVDQFSKIILLAVFANVIPYLYTAIADLICIARHDKLSKRPVLLSIISILAGCFSFWAICNSGRDTVFYGAVLLLSSVPLYAYIKHKNKLGDKYGR